MEPSNSITDNELSLVIVETSIGLDRPWSFCYIHNRMRILRMIMCLLGAVL